jgi:hypothetical protein
MKNLHTTILNSLIELRCCHLTEITQSSYAYYCPISDSGDFGVDYDVVDVIKVLPLSTEIVWYDGKADEWDLPF